MNDPPLISAIRNGYSDDIIRNLMKTEDVNLQNSEGYTALMYLINLDPHKKSLIKDLVKISDCNIKDLFGHNILFILMEGIVYNHFDIKDVMPLLEIVVPYTDLSQKCLGMDILEYIQRSERYFLESKKRRELYKEIEYLLVSSILDK